MIRRASVAKAQGNLHFDPPAVQIPAFLCRFAGYNQAHDTGPHHCQHNRGALPVG